MAAAERSNDVHHAVQTITQQHQKQHEQHINIVRRHFSNKGYRVHSGLQFGCELVLYADNPGRVHSDFCVHVLPPSQLYSSSSSTIVQKEEERNDALAEAAAAVIDWRTIQTLVRSMPDLRKTLIIARVRRCHRDHRDISGCIGGGGGSVHDDIPTTAKVNSSSDSIKSSTTSIIKQNLQDKETIIENEKDEGGDGEDEYHYIVDELAIATEHAPFRHKNIPLGVGTQIKPS
jgi:hypothetical protein